MVKETAQTISLPENLEARGQLQALLDDYESPALALERQHLDTNSRNDIPEHVMQILRTLLEEGVVLLASLELFFSGIQPEAFEEANFIAAWLQIQEIVRRSELAKLKEEIQVRDASTLTEVELEELTALAKIGFAGADVKKTLAHFAQSMVVIQRNDNNEVVGMAMVGKHQGDFSARTDNKDDDLRVLCFNTAVVRPDYRRMGIATKMTAARFEQIANDWFGLKDNAFVYSDFDDGQLMSVFKFQAEKYGFSQSEKTDGMLGSFGQVNVLPNEFEEGVKSTILTFMHGDRKDNYHERQIVRIVLTNPDQNVKTIVKEAKAEAEKAFAGKNSSDFRSGWRWWDLDSSKSSNIEDIVLKNIEKAVIKIVRYDNKFDALLEADEWRIEQERLVRQYEEDISSVTAEDETNAFIPPIPIGRRVAVSKDLSNSHS